MKRTIAAIAVVASLALAPQAIAHPNVTGSASQACDTETGNVILTATFSNAGFDEETNVTPTDSGGASLPSGGSPYSATATVPGPDRAAGTVSFAWTAGNDSGTITAPYDAVTGCVGPPPPPPPPPPPCHVNCGHIPHHHMSVPPAGSPRQGTPNHVPRTPTHVARQAPPGVQGGELPFSGLPLGWMAFVACGLIGVGGALKRKVD